MKAELIHTAQFAAVGNGQVMKTELFTPHNLLEWGQTGDENRAVHTAQSAGVGTDR